MDSASTMFRVKATRAQPPGRAKLSERRATYDAALAQFEELLAAARAAGPASRPLPLFYALSQAGRAIAAAAVGDAPDARWKLKSHGLSAPQLDRDLVDVRVGRPRARDQEESIDSFGGVAGLFGGEVFDGSVSIGEVWASLPGVEHLLPREATPGVNRPAWIVPDDPGGFATPMFPWGRVDVTVVGLDVEGEKVPERLNSLYLPADAPKAELFSPQGVGPVAELTSAGPGFKLSFPADAPNYHGHIRTLERLDPAALGFDAFPVMPRIGRALVTRIGRWWVLLFGLSMIARYEPGRWLDTLNPRDSTLAAPTEELLRLAIDEVPELVWDALMRARAEQKADK